jgi:hypothetical protein
MPPITIPVPLTLVNEFSPAMTRTRHTPGEPAPAGGLAAIRLMQPISLLRRVLALEGMLILQPSPRWHPSCSKIIG